MWTLIDLIEEGGSLRQLFPLTLHRISKISNAPWL